MMLNKDKLQELNRYMVGLGAPIEKDGVGYNKPDYIHMEGLARYTGTIDDSMAYTIAEYLSHYKNTQLSEIANDIDETVDHYKELVGSVKDYKNIARTHKCSEFIPYEIHMVSKTDTEFIISFDGKVFLPDLGLSFWREVQWTDRTYTTLSVPKNRIDSFMKAIRDYGNYGYVPDAEFTEEIESYRKSVADGHIVEPDTMRINKEISDHDYLYVQFNGFADIRDFIAQERLIDSDCLKWTRVGGTMYLVTKMSEIYYLYAKVKTLGFFNNELEKGIKSVTLKSYAERKNAATGAQNAKRNTENRSNNHLVDVNQYDLPFTPYKFQLEDAKTLVEHNRMLIGSDMGTGKTFISILVGESINTPKLVICPESLRLNWRKEIKNVVPNANIRILYSKDDFDITKDNIPDWTITGYKTVTKFVKQLAELKYNCIFIDEAHNCKAVNNYGKPGSKRAEAVLTLCDKAKHVYPMTGTPIPTRNKDLFNVFRMLNIRKLGNTDLTGKWGFYQYGQKFCDGHRGSYGWMCDGNSCSDELHNHLSFYMVRRLKKEVLPNLVKQRTFIPTESTSREYKDIERRLHNMSDEDTYMGLAMTGRRILSKEKVLTAIDYAESILSENRSVVIVSNFNETLDTIMKKFGDDCCTIRGGMTDEAKQQAKEDFQSGKKHVCALNIIAGGVGVTLTAAHDMIIVDYDWTPANMSQVEDRICRAGQTECCNIHYIYCENSILDTVFVDMITAKSANIDMVIDGAQNTMDLAEGVSYMQALKNAVSY